MGWSAADTFKDLLEKVSSNLSKATVDKLADMAVADATYAYKDVCMILEKQIKQSSLKGKERLNVFYVLSAICRRSKKQYKEKDKYGPRIAGKLENIAGYLSELPNSQWPAVAKVAAIWSKEGIVPRESLAHLQEFGNQPETASSEPLSLAAAGRIGEPPMVAKSSVVQPSSDCRKQHLPSITATATRMTPPLSTATMSTGPRIGSAESSPVLPRPPGLPVPTVEPLLLPPARAGSSAAVEQKSRKRKSRWDAEGSQSTQADIPAAVPPLPHVAEPSQPAWPAAPAPTGAPPPPTAVNANNASWGPPPMAASPQPTPGFSFAGPASYPQAAVAQPQPPVHPQWHSYGGYSQPLVLPAASLHQGRAPQQAASHYPPAQPQQYQQPHFQQQQQPYQPLPPPSQYSHRAHQPQQPGNWASGYGGGLQPPPRPPAGPPPPPRPPQQLQNTAPPPPPSPTALPANGQMEAPQTVAQPPGAARRTAAAQIAHPDSDKCLEGLPEIRKETDNAVATQETLAEFEKAALADLEGPFQDDVPPPPKRSRPAEPPKPVSNAPNPQLAVQHMMSIALANRQPIVRPAAAGATTEAETAGDSSPRLAA